MKGLGFTDIFDVSGLLSVANLIPQKKRCGIYMLEFSDGLCYIGQATDVVRRFGQHRKTYDSIIKLSFQRVKKTHLDEVEKALINKAESLKIPLTNKVHVSSIIGKSDLDLLISPEEQELWLNSPRKLPEESFRISNASQRTKYKYNFQRFQTYAEYRKVIDVLRLYVRNCIPAFRKTELAFWSLSCLPSTNSSTSPRLACISIYVPETFVIGHLKGNPNEIWAFVNVSKVSLFRSDPLQWKFRIRHPEIILQQTLYRDFGPDQIQLSMKNLKQVNRLLNDPSVLGAARLLNLRLMRKGATMQWRSHCFDLADQVV